MEILVNGLEAGEIVTTSFTNQRGEQKSLVKREFVLSTADGTIVAEMFGDACYSFTEEMKTHRLWQAQILMRMTQSKDNAARKWNNVQIVSLKAIL